MALEIEHKFLVINAAWREKILRSTPLVQGYFPSRPGEPVVRVRLRGDRSFLTIKGLPHGITRSEFEYEIPRSDAEKMLQEFAPERRVEKIRHLVAGPDGAVWELDEYRGRHTGLFTAELELKSEQDTFTRPAWLGREISQDFHFSNFYLSYHDLKEVLSEL